MRVERERLDRTINPRTVAVVGDAKIRNYRWLKSMETFQGPVYSVQVDPNEIPNIEEMGTPNYTSLLEIPDEIDFVLVAVPRNVAPFILRQCVEKDVAGAAFFTSGFAETDSEDGRELQATMTELARDSGLALIGLGNIIGSLGCGVLGGRYRKKNVLSALYLGRALLMAGFLVVPVSVASILIFSFTIGLLWLGTVPLTSGLVAHFFGVRYMATLFGFVFFSHQLGSFLGVWYGGYAFDRGGSYDPVWWAAIALGLISAALHWPIRERPAQRLAPAG